MFIDTDDRTDLNMTPLQDHQPDTNRQADEAGKRIRKQLPTPGVGT